LPSFYFLFFFSFFFLRRLLETFVPITGKLQNPQQVFSFFLFVLPQMFLMAMQPWLHWHWQARAAVAVGLLDVTAKRRSITGVCYLHGESRLLLEINRKIPFAGTAVATSSEWRSV